MSAKRENPWYILGTELTEKYTIDDALRLVKGDDDVTPATLYTIEVMEQHNLITKDGVSEGFFIPKDALEEVQGSIGIKSDIYGTMATTSPSYDITQRREVTELAYEIVGLRGDEAMIKSIGHVGPRAQQFFVYIELPTLVIDPNGIADEIMRGLYAATSFDGSMATTIGESDLRIGCTNQLAMALRGLERPIKVHHRAGAEQRLRQAAEAWEYAGAVENAKIKMAEKMLKVDGGKAMHALLDNWWDVSDPDLPANTRTRRENARDELWALYWESPSLKDKVHEDGWRAYNAFTEYYDHYRPVRGVGEGGESVRRAATAVLPGAQVNDKMKASKIITALAA